MGKIVRVSLSFDFYPDEDELMTDMTDEELMEYATECVVDDIYSYIGDGQVGDILTTEIIKED
jgi:hypothetical protein